MTTDQTFTLTPDLGGLNDSLSGAAGALQGFANGPVADAAKSIETAVTRSFKSVESTIARAVVSGKLSMDDLVRSILADFDRIAIRQFVTKPIEGLIDSFASSVLSIGGARAAGGPVDAGTAYLVGEQGPELFVPQTGGTVVANGAPPQRPQIVMNVTARDAQSFLKSEPQIAAMLARAIARGQRNL